jgi:dolichyl-phosphate-mannose-protein mannosyltransferase
MAKVKNALGKLGRWEYSWVCLLLLITLAMHFTIIDQPAEIMFDENHYVPDARTIISGNDTARAEHPPLGKLTFVTGIRIFGDNPVGWRIFPVLSGTLSILLFYLICRRLSLSRRTALLATFLLAFENMTFVQSSIAMLDVFCLTFMLLAFWLYLRRSYPLAAVAIGLAMLMKITGVFAIPIILAHWLIRRRDQQVTFVASTLLVPFTFLLLMALLGYFTFGHIVNPAERLSQMMSLSGSLTFATATHSAVSRPWEWVLKPMAMSFWYTPHYLSVISYNLWGLIIPATGYMTWQAIRKNNGGLFGALWFAGTFLLLIPASIISDRVSFLYYFYPSIGAICLGVGMVLNQLLEIRENRPSSRWRKPLLGIVIVYLVAHAAVFAGLSPLWSWPF